MAAPRVSKRGDDMPGADMPGAEVSDAGLGWA